MAYTDPAFVARLAGVLRGGRWELHALRDLARYACPEDRRLVLAMVDEVWAAFAGARPGLKTLAALLQQKIAASEIGPEIRRLDLRPPRMTARWNVPILPTPGALAAWLDVPPGRLDWLADVKGLTLKQPAPKLRHYVNVLVPRRRGKARLLEVPKLRLKAIQGRILRDILDRIPAHDAAHGFRRQRSIVSYVEPHVGQRIVLHYDLRDFFASISAARVQAIFRAAGYPRAVARLLSGLCTTRTPHDFAVDQPRLRARHLPQGAPSSPALANLAAYRLDVRLHALAHKLDAAYTRYADDLAFSGGERLARAARRVEILAAVIAAEEGFDLHHRKTRVMRQGVRQELAGVVVNSRVNARRKAVDELKAILHNCVRLGPASQNRGGHGDFRSHLRGRIAFVTQLNPARGAKLRAIFESIEWHGFAGGADSIEQSSP